MSHSPVESVAFAEQRAAELRQALMTEIARAQTRAATAMLYLSEADDEAAIAVLRDHWSAVRNGIAPLAAEFALLIKTVKALNIVSDSDGIAHGRQG